MNDFIIMYIWLIFIVLLKNKEIGGIKFRKGFRERNLKGVEGVVGNKYDRNILYIFMGFLKNEWNGCIFKNISVVKSFCFY